MLRSGDHQDFFRVITHLTAAVTNSHLYAISHPQVTQCIDRAYNDLSEILRHRPEITVFLIDDDLVVDKRPISSNGQVFDKFVRIMQESGIERITFMEGLPRKDLQDLIQNLGASGASPLQTSTHIKLGKVELRVDREEDTDVSLSNTYGEDLEISIDLKDANLNILKELYTSMKKKKKVDVHGIDVIVKGFIKGIREGMGPISLLTSLKSMDEYTFTHGINVCVLTMSQAEAMGFEGDLLHHIGVASSLHDIGKLFIPDEILNKPGELTRKEREIIKSHAVKGASYIMELKDIPNIAVLGALEHHIKFNGQGYPRVRSSYKPNIVSQMIAISDVFDALRSTRPYRKGRPQKEVVNILQSARGNDFSPQLVDIFIKAIVQKNKRRQRR
ncbi:MAG: HD-GYP domain-containing protein [bacterium]